MKKMLLLLAFVPAMATAQNVGKIFNHTEVGKLAGPNTNQQTSPTIANTSFNYMVSQNLGVGVTSGVEFYHNAYVPLAANFIIPFNNNKTRPFLHIQGGTLLPVGKSEVTIYDLQQYYKLSITQYPNNTKLESKSGFMLNPALGIITEVNNNLDVSFSLGYRYQKMNFAGTNDYKIETNMNRLSIKAGFILK